MSFQDPPRRQRPPRYPALAPYEHGPSSSQGTHNGYGGMNGQHDAYQGFAGLTDTPRQRPSREPRRQQPPWEAPRQQPPWEAPRQRTTGGHRRTQDAFAQDAFARETSWDIAGQPARTEPGAGLPRRTSGAFRAAPAEDPGRPRAARHGHRPGGQPRTRGLAPGAVTGFLAAAVALGVANLVAAFVRPQASPIIAVGGAFIDRTPPALKNFAVEKFGENDKNMLLLGMYVTIALIAIAIGMLAWRRPWIGVTGIGLFGLFGAFVAITRPESHVTDVIPSIAGGIAGIAAIVLLVNARMPRTRAAWTRRR